MSKQVRETQEAWETLAAEQALDVLGTTHRGLGGEEARQRLARYGKNELPASEPPPFWLIFARQFKSPLIYVLAIAAIISFAIGEVVDAGFIAGVLLINALIGGVMEWRAERGVRALQTMLRAQATVERDGRARVIEAEELVPGDIVWLESGLRVPADLRLIQTTGLNVDESLLTGESVGVVKDAAWVAKMASPAADRRNMALAGSIVIRGRAQGVVVATGLRTVLGTIAGDVLEAEPARPPLVVRMERFVRMVAIAIVGLVLLTAALGLVRGFSAEEMFFLGVALAVSAIPEGLPVGLTVVLAIATIRMVRRNVVTRHLPVVEGLGSCTLIISDKTGTLTVNELTVRQIRLVDGTAIEVTGQGFLPDGVVCLDGEAVMVGHNQVLDDLVRAVVLNNEASLIEAEGRWEWRGDPTDIALLALGHKYGQQREVVLPEEPCVAQIPFEPENRYSATFHSVLRASTTRVYVKGGPERMLELSAFGVEAEREALRTMAHEMAAQGFRVLAISIGDLEEPIDSGRPPSPKDLRFLGLVGMIDPLRAGAKDAVERAHRAGVEVFMVTGDHPLTALAISRELGIAHGEDKVVAGGDLGEATDKDMEELVRTRHVFARMAPHQKLDIVRAAQRVGHFVAVTGDGINDAPALQAANIGVAMGKAGTDVAREAAGIVISDDNFASIVNGIEEGRVAYDNIRKVIFLLLSTGAAEIALLMTSIAVGLPIPITPIQILWLNVATNGIQHLALATEPNEGDVLERPPRRPNEPIFNRLMIERILLTAVVIGGIGTGLFWWLLEQGWTEFAARNALLLFLVLFENVHVGLARSETKSVLRLSPLRVPILVGAVLIAQLMHIGAMYLPWTQGLLEVEPVPLTTWLLLLMCVMPIVLTIEAHKWLARRRARKQV
ncbi:MAG: HAD-IC family P-type ATPase [Bradymonadaceae bacterium]|nr:HAD-IC family P-type ATPase [Lujinxingiaceae bacterium]